MTPPSGTFLLVDVGSTWTKAVLVDAAGTLAGRASHPTTLATDVMDGVRAVRRDLTGSAEPIEGVTAYACSSAGGGLRLAVVGYEREVTAEAGRRVGLSAGARVVHVASGSMTGPDLARLRADRPDIILLVGGTDGGNADVLVHNAARLARARVTAPIVVAGNAAAADQVADELARTGRRFTVTDNVVPRIGAIRPEGAREAIREAFLAHVIGGKGLSRGREFGTLVRAATPDAVLAGVEVLADVLGSDVLVLDIGGATTDCYSVLTPSGEDAVLAKDVVGTLWQARSVEADLGMRWSAQGIVDAAERERIPLADKAIAYAGRVGEDVEHLPTAAEWPLERDLARVAAVVAARRHGRPAAPGAAPRPLRDVRLLVGGGGVLRHAPAETGSGVLQAVRTDHAGGWHTPDRADLTVDADYVLFAVGLLAAAHPTTARALALRLLGRH